MSAERTSRVHRFDAWTAEEQGPQPWLVDMGGRRAPMTAVAPPGNLGRGGLSWLNRMVLR